MSQLVQIGVKIPDASELWDPRIPGGKTCVSCKGEKLLCGMDKCPILVKFYAKVKTAPSIDSLHLEGSSPPSVFVGRFGYPKVHVGPMIPPVSGDTTMMDMPEMWFGKSIEEITDFRFSLVRGKYLTDVHNVEGAGKIVDNTREMAMAKTSADAAVVFKKKPMGRISLSEEVQPYGPSAPLAQFEIGTMKTEHKIEKAYSDTDLKAAPAVLRLYDKNVPISKIQKAFSVGLFGLGKNRKFVPTRWSITAVDSTIGEELIDNTKKNPVVSDYMIFQTENLDNRWIVLMFPSVWSYELVEAWYPNTLWNPMGKGIYMVASHEFYFGRKKYAEIGGCYYAARMAVNEYLNARKRQAGVVVLREAHPGYIMPVGVWNVRESVRAAMETKPLRFGSLKESMDHMKQVFSIPIERWTQESEVLKHLIHQRRITDFVD